MSRVRRPAVRLALVLAVAALAGCTVRPAADRPEPVPALAPVRIGILATPDALPLLVAEERGLFAQAGLKDAQVVAFASPAELRAAFASGAVDAFEGDIISAAALESRGHKVTIATTMLGATPTEGRWGIVGPPGSPVRSLKALGTAPVGVSREALDAYVLDGLAREAGVAAGAVKTVEVASALGRVDQVVAGKLKVALLPEPYLSLATSRGAVLIADDTKGSSLSQTALVFTDDFIRSAGGIESEVAVLDAWDLAVAAIDAEPDSFRGLLVEKGALPEALKSSYDVDTYPTASAPDTEQVGAVLAWMKAKGSLPGTVTYESLVIVTP